MGDTMILNTRMGAETNLACTRIADTHSGTCFLDLWFEFAQCPFVEFGFSEAFVAREQSLIQDRKELEDEYKKLLELRKTDKHLDSWSNDSLPDCVSKLLQ